jgi:hypothetical protein
MIKDLYSYAQAGRKIWELNDLAENAVDTGEENSSKKPDLNLNLEGILFYLRVTAVVIR